MGRQIDEDWFSHGEEEGGVSLPGLSNTRMFGLVTAAEACRMDLHAGR